MARVAVTLPKLGESIVSATIVSWFKKVGDHIALDEPLLEVSTDKVNSEIPSPYEGTLVEILAQPDQELDVGAELAIIETDAGEFETPSKPAQEAPKQETSGDASSTFLSPAVLSLAREHNISMSELESMTPSGNGGRLSKKDIERHLATRHTPTHNDPQAGVEPLKMSGMRKAIADNMVRSFYEAPHASLVIDADVTDLMKRIADEKESHGFKLTITPFIVKAIAEAAAEFPLINASLDGDTILIKRHINLGIAVSVDQGLLVPVIRNCHTRDLLDIGREIADISDRARAGTIPPDSVKEGTITMTNFGMSGTLLGTPIIRHPEVAIIGVGAIHKTVTAMDDESIAIRRRIYLSLTFDHRVLDGMYGCGFLAALKSHIENPPLP